MLVKFVRQAKRGDDKVLAESNFSASYGVVTTEKEPAVHLSVSGDYYYTVVFDIKLLKEIYEHAQEKGLI